MNLLLTFGLLLPFFGTSLGAAFIFFMKSSLRPLAEQVMLGFAAGVMTAASIWSLLIPAMEQASWMEMFAFVPAAVGFLGGVAFLAATDALVRYLEEKGKPCPGVRRGQRSLMTLAVVIHNIPEGLSVGAALAAVMASPHQAAAASALALSAGVAVQNLPEGFIVALPARSGGEKRITAFLKGVLSGIPEPAAGSLMLLLAARLTPLLPYLLAFSAGAMFCVVLEELIPAAMRNKRRHGGTCGFCLGFLLMMILDVALG
ncbi:MAG TPA: ZIP family metal transporter [Candidatus Pullilachnospira intestinigallinarum]|nr:ZIP family metal transporter [Candidatus Pullilachnospira intestinigallinarum]